MISEIGTSGILQAHDIVHWESEDGKAKFDLAEQIETHWSWKFCLPQTISSSYTPAIRWMDGSINYR